MYNSSIRICFCILQHCSLFISVHSRYHEENRNMAFGEFKFGPLFMRLCYELGLEELGARTLTDPVCENEHKFYTMTMDMNCTSTI